MDKNNEWFTMEKTLFVDILREKKLMLPPLSGYTDYPYRKILAKFKPPFITTEMVNARAVIENNKNTAERLKKEEGPHLRGVQLLGKDPKYMKKAAITIRNLGFDYIDINMGCTVRKVISKGEGISLMKNEDLACKIVKTVSEAVDVPVTVKLRAGFSKESINVVSLSKKLEDAGAAAVTIHGRTGEKKFNPKMDLNVIRDVAEALFIPVIANGGIFSSDDAKNALIKTGASAVMPGRGIIGNPWLITEILYGFSKESFISPSLKERKDVCIEHVKSNCSYYGVRNGVCKMRKIVARYFPLAKNLKFLKVDMQNAKTVDEIFSILNKIKEVDTVWIYER